MNSVLIPPTPAVQRVADLLEATIQKFLDARSTISSLGRFEADDEAHLLITLIVRHAEGVIALARGDLVLLPPAIAASRAAFESAIRALWMLAPEDPFEREVRWLVGLEEYEGYYKNLADEYDKLGVESSDALDLRRRIQAFRLKVQRDLPPEYRLLPGRPNFKKMLDAIGDSPRYTWYIVASNHTHPTQVATSLYRRHFGTAKEFGEFIRPNDWYWPMLLCAFALHTTGAKFLDRCRGDSKAFVTAHDVTEMERALAALTADE